MVKYGVVYTNSDTYEVDENTFKNSIVLACYSNLLSSYSNDSYNKYLHITFNPFPEFTKEEVIFFLDYLKSYFKLDYEFRELNVRYGVEHYLPKGTEYPIITVNLHENNRGEVILLYHLLRLLHECNTYIERTSICLKTCMNNSEISLITALFTIFSFGIYEFNFELSHTIFHILNSKFITCPSSDFILPDEFKTLTLEEVVNRSVKGTRDASDVFQDKYSFNAIKVLIQKEYSKYYEKIDFKKESLEKFIKENL